MLGFVDYFLLDAGVDFHGHFSGYFLFIRTGIFLRKSAAGFSPPHHLIDMLTFFKGGGTGGPRTSGKTWGKVSTVGRVLWE
jgi:hypothetical protein